MAEIYKITNKIDNKVYIGQTVQGTETRFRQHAQRASSGCEGKLHTAMREQGLDNFCVEVIDRCDEGSLDDREKYWIAYYDSMNNGYNMTAGGNGGSIYLIDDIEMRRMWDGGSSLSEIADKFGCSVKAISSRLVNYPSYSQEEAHLRASAKPVYQYDLAGMFCGEYRSTTAAEVALNGAKARGRDNIGACARGEQRIAYGYYWSYEKMEQGPVLYTVKGITCPIAQYSKNGEWIATYESLADAELAMIAKGYKRPHISEVCQRRPKYNSSCGYVWRYIYDEEVNRPTQSSVAELATLLDG